MVSRGLIVWIVGFASTWFVAQSAAAAVWSIKTDCEEGDWTVEIELAGFGTLDASCVDGTKKRLSVDVGDLGVTSTGITATSASGTICDATSAGEPRFKLECGEKSEDIDGFELEEEIEVELELEQEEEDDEAQEDEEDLGEE
ncbi:MAG: hypothetical protein JRG86_08180 [Deltaproteobacteria bacterium]|jgi:hypothetical protein|nr:hypothetical protein [Deltaproteobacteria bacterium]MBW2498731.1 hypothetical protein [Deltaproteobacteria bacterium]